MASERLVVFALLIITAERRTFEIIGICACECY